MKVDPTRCPTCEQLVRFSKAYGVWMHEVTDAVTETHRAASPHPTCSMCGVPIAEHPDTDACALRDETHPPSAAAT
jgi:hypothetical protein